MKYSSPLLHHRKVWSIADIPVQDVDALLQTARALKRASRSGLASAPLRGKHIAVVAGHAPAEGADSLERAARELGARVTVLPASGPTAGLNGSPSTYRVLGRLYDAIDCLGLNDEQLHRMEHDAGVPVFDGIAGMAHPARLIGELLEMQEHSGRPLPGMRVDFQGDATSPRGRAFTRLAEREGIALSTDESSRAAADFVIDAHDDAGRWRCSAGGTVIDDAVSADDHRYVLQALLLMTM